MVLIPLFGRWPIDQVFRYFFPFTTALGTFITDAVSDNFILGDDLVGTIFQNEALVHILRKTGWQIEDQHSHQDGNEAFHGPSFRRRRVLQRHVRSFLYPRKAPSAELVRPGLNFSVFLSPYFPGRINCAYLVRQSKPQEKGEAAMSAKYIFVTGGVVSSLGK